jgi:hypothetical protein
MGLTQKIWLLITAPFILAIVAYVAATRPLRRELLLTEASREIREDVSVLESALSHGVVDPERTRSRTPSASSASRSSPPTASCSPRPTDFPRIYRSNRWRRRRSAPAA